MKTFVNLCLALLFFPVCHAQLECGLNVPDIELFDALNGAGYISEPDDTKFILQDLTYLCFVRSISENKAFDEVRVSFLYTYDGTMNQSAQATFTLCLDTFIYTMADVEFVTQDPHLTENMTREDCQDCRDNSTFARPTFCRCECGSAVAIWRAAETSVMSLCVAQLYVCPFCLSSCSARG